MLGGGLGTQDVSWLVNCVRDPQPSPSSTPEEDTKAYEGMQRVLSRIAQE